MINATASHYLRIGQSLADASLLLKLRALKRENKLLKIQNKELKRIIEVSQTPVHERVNY
jgi:hypothetical protein